MSHEVVRKSMLGEERARSEMIQKPGTIVFRIPPNLFTRVIHQTERLIISSASLGRMGLVKVLEELEAEEERTQSLKGES